MSVLFLVLDGMPVRHVGRRHTPTLAALAAGGGHAPMGGRAVAPSSTYPNHATFVTGLGPGQHGVHGNHVVDADGGVRDADTVGPSGTTLFDVCRAAGRTSAAVLGDHHLVGVLRADRADRHWPPQGRLPADVARDALGYAADAEVATRLRPVLELAPDLVVAHLNQPDTTEHLHGPDSEAAFAQYRATDAVLAEILDPVARRWSDWAVVVVSDHDQETVTVAEPVDLAAAARAAGVDMTVVPEGASALMHGADPDSRWLDAVPGIEGHQRIGERLRLVWTAPGRWFGAAPLPLRGVHGAPRHAAQVAVCGGGHPAVPALAARLRRCRPAATDWYAVVQDLITA
ncbi:MAG TPA: alkaline phosphatase family protein [Pseudonocardia sp.]